MHSVTTTVQSIELLTCQSDPGIIRNHSKITAIIHNAKCYLDLTEKYGSFSTYLWDFVNGKPIINYWKQSTDVPAVSVISDKLAKNLQRQGFKFVGSKTCYAFMQAVGMVDDHLISCFVRQK